MPQSHKQCEICQEQPATVHLTEMANQHVVKERHLCDSCAQKEGLVGKVQLNLVTELLGQLKGSGKAAAKETEVKCPDCGMAYTEFRSKARFGCARDYEIFRKHVVALLEKIHGTTVHAGKKPKKHAPPPRTPAKAEPESPLSEMEKEMEKAIQAEEYEKAAKLRDRIRQARGKKEKPQ